MASLLRLRKEAKEGYELKRPQSQAYTTGTSSGRVQAETTSSSRFACRRGETVEVAKVTLVKQRRCNGIKCPCLSFISNTWCEMTIGFCILVNTILFGAEVEYLAFTLNADTHVVFQVASYWFFVIFLIELVIRMLLDSYDFFIMSENLPF